ncbi:MAG TPA: hypothetical protein VME22_33465 [Solirubrobacteraceae bacterium]|nr:hypothetical protein [Solirubrobacteraceae bacterium]
MSNHLSHYSAPGARHRTPGCDSRHDEAILRAEIKRLVRALSPYGVLSRDALGREVGADSWHEPRFERALDAAVKQGKIVALPLGFYGLPHHV